MSTSTEVIEQLANTEYKYGFVTDVEQDIVAQGAERGRRPADLGEEGRAGVAARLAAQGVSRVAEDDRADVAERHVRADRLPGHQLLRGAEGEEEAGQHGRGRPRDPGDLRQARHSARSSSSCSPAWRWTRCSTRCRWRPRSARSWPSSASSSARSPRRCASIPSWCKQYLGSVVPHTDNFFAALNSAVFSDGSFVFVPKGVRCPMELSTYFRINAKDTGQFERTLIVCDEGRHGQLPRRLHGADARREPAARGGRRADRARRRDDQVLDGAELVSRRQGRQGRHLQLRDQARPVQGPRLEDHVDAGRDRLGDHLEVSRAASCRATTRSASSTRWR